VNQEKNDKTLVFAYVTLRRKADAEQLSPIAWIGAERIESGIHFHADQRRRVHSQIGPEA